MCFADAINLDSINFDSFLHNMKLKRENFMLKPRAIQFFLIKIILSDGVALNWQCGKVINVEQVKVIKVLKKYCFSQEIQILENR